MNDETVSDFGASEEENILELDDFDVEKTLSSSAPVSANKPEDAGELFSLNSEEAGNIEQNEESFEAEPEAEPEQSAVFKELANPKLPFAATENRAYLQMQSPSRIFFYWSIQNNSFETLHRALGNRAKNYEIAVKLVNLTTGSEQIMPADAAGSAWFNAQPNCDYRAEIGFHAVSRPFIRLIFSNTLRTPRSAPSPNTDYRSYFAVTPTQFAEVLDSSGYTQDAFDVFLTGDFPETADEATRLAYSKIAGGGGGDVDFAEIKLAELRSVLFVLASGATLADLRDAISPKLFEFLQTLSASNPKSMTEENVIGALEEFFGFSPFFEETEEEFFLPSVFGASSIHFPKNTRRKIRFSPDKIKSFNKSLSPLSSQFLTRGS